MSETYTREELFGRTELLAGPDMMARLAALRVIVFGVGGVGSWAAEGLVRAGVGHLTIVDPDSVAVSNINRQLPATTLTVGRPKVDVLASRFREINPHAEITDRRETYSPETAADFDLAAYDYVVDAIDSLSCKAHLILHADSLGCRLVSSMGAARKLDPSKIAVADFRKVQGCPLARALRNRFKRTGAMPRRKFRCVYSPELLPNRGADADTRVNGTFAPATAIFGMTLASLILEDIYKQTT